MREAEIKARAADPEAVRAVFSSRLGDGRPVHKLDHYFRRPGESIQALRIREHGGALELTAKRTHSGPGGENNEEYEFRALPDQLEAALAFFRILGYEDFFIKKKDGYEWMDGDAHIELLSVNSLGWFLEIEVLLPFEAGDADVAAAHGRITALMEEAGLSSDDFEPRSYREMILEAEGGIQGKPYTR